MAHKTKKRQARKAQAAIEALRLYKKLLKDLHHRLTVAQPA